MRIATMLGRLRPRSGYDLVAVLALVLALGGGTAMAAFVVSSNSQIGPNTISGSRRPTGFANDNVANASIDVTDLASDAKTRRLEFDRPDDATVRPIATVGNVALSGECRSAFGETTFTVYAKNVTSQLGTIDIMVAREAVLDNNADPVFTSGASIGAGETHTVDALEPPANNEPLIYAGASWYDSRAEGQVVFHTPGRVTTIIFHAYVTFGQCELAGTAVSAINRA